jgi:hypothetical protein
MRKNLYVLSFQFAKMVNATQTLKIHVLLVRIVMWSIILVEDALKRKELIVILKTGQRFAI